MDVIFLFIERKIKMDYKCWYKKFNDYAKNFDLKKKWIMYKYHHTYRVVEYAKKIAISLKLKEEDFDLAILSSLLHDIARFEQWTKYETYVDAKSFDHGDQGYKILKENNYINEYIESKEKQDIVLYAVKNHNKKNIDDSINDSKYQLIANIVRDADKLDIMMELCNFIKDDSSKLNDIIVEKINNRELCDNKYIKNDVDGILRALGFIFDLNCKYSFEFILKNKIIENKIQLLEIYTNDERLEEIKNNLINYAKEKIKC